MLRVCPPGGADASDEGAAGEEQGLRVQEEQGDRLSEERPAQSRGTRDGNTLSDLFVSNCIITYIFIIYVTDKQKFIQAKSTSSPTF